MLTLQSARLVLRSWHTSDFLAFAKLNADSEVMRYFPKMLSRAESDALANSIQQQIAKNGWGLWAAALQETREFIGFIGLSEKPEDSGIPNAPMLEVGWRLARPFWGNGYAPEGAQLALRFAFGTLNVSEVYSFTALENRASRRVMEKIGMSNTHKDFDHPDIATHHPLRRHCLYRISANDWLKI